MQYPACVDSAGAVTEGGARWTTANTRNMENNLFLGPRADYSQILRGDVTEIALLVSKARTRGGGDIETVTLMRGGATHGFETMLWFKVSKRRRSFNELSEELQ